MGKTSIEWTDASWNPIVGCTEISPGCANCYAARLAATRLKHVNEYVDLAKMVDGKPRWNGEVGFCPGRLEEPLRWAKLRRIFVCDMGDLFHERCAVQWIERIFAIMAAARRHTFQVLTKRASIARTLLSSETFRKHVFEMQMDGPLQQLRKNQKNQNFITSDWPLPNVWLGVSVENQHFADERIPLLLQTPAAVRWISAEPLLGPVDLWNLWKNVSGQEIDKFWVVCGGESGPNARPMHPDWARSLRDQCQTAGVPFFFKQWGEWAPYTGEPDPADWHEKHPGKITTAWPNGVVRNTGATWIDGGLGTYLWKCGKKKSGRLLDGREWNEFPQVTP